MHKKNQMNSEEAIKSRDTLAEHIAELKSQVDTIEYAASVKTYALYICAKEFMEAVEAASALHDGIIESSRMLQEIIETIDREQL